MIYSPWSYFLSLEADFALTTRYVHISTGNYKTYSIEYVKLILSSCSEIDVLLKLICKEHEPTTTVNNIDQYRPILLKYYPDIVKTEVSLPRYQIKLLPWEKWSEETNPDWWRDYNDIKHVRSSNFEKANLFNTMYAMGGLVVLLVYWCNKLKKYPINESTLLFDMNGIPKHITTEG